MGVVGKENGRILVSSNCVVCGSKNSNFTKKQEASGLLSSLGIKTGLDKIPFVGTTVFRGINTLIQGIK